jgi:hypothetical protein
VTTPRGKYLVLRVNGPAGPVRVRIVLLKRGHVYRTVLRTIPANRQIRVTKLLIPRSVTSVRVNVVS